MIKVFKLVHNYYDSEAAVNLNFNTCSMTTGNMYKLQKFTYHYNLRKYSVCSRVVNMRWWRLILLTFLRIVLINTGLTKRLFVCLTGTGDLPICIWCGCCARLSDLRNRSIAQR